VTFRRCTAQPAGLRTGWTSRDVTFHSSLLHDVLACRCGAILGAAKALLSSAGPVGKSNSVRRIFVSKKRDFR
jgi:hypothetical protein